MKDFDVIVIGGGPSGLQTAHLLSNEGLNIGLFEQDSEIGKDVVCSGVISKEAFSRYDLPVESITGRLKEAELFSPSNKNITYFHPEESVVVVDRNKFDTLLAKRAQGSGTQIFLNSKVLSLDPLGDFVETKVKINSKIRNIRSKIAIIATGICFNLQSSLGMGRPKKILKGIQVEIDMQELKRLNMFWGNSYSKGFFGWAIPVSDGRVKVGVMTDGNALEGLNNILKQLGLSERCKKENCNIKRRGISFGTIKRKYTNRVLAVGEAAGFVKTTTGGGIYYGLISAELASKVINEAFKKNSFDYKTLSKYEKLSNEEFSKEIIFGEYFHRFYSVLNDNEINLLFDAAKKDNLLSYISKKGKFDWHKDVIINILKSPNLRKVLVKRLIKQGALKLAFSN